MHRLRDAWERFFLVAIFDWPILITYTTPDIQKHGAIRNTKYDANLLGCNIKGGWFWCANIHKCDNVPTVIIVRMYEEYDFEDNFVNFRISMWYVKPISPFHYETFLYFVVLSLLANLLFYLYI